MTMNHFNVLFLRPQLLWSLSYCCKETQYTITNLIKDHLIGSLFMFSEDRHIGIMAGSMVSAMVLKSSWELLPNLQTKRKEKLGLSQALEISNLTHCDILPPRPDLLILLILKLYYSLMTKNSNLWTYGCHSYSNNPNNHIKIRVCN